MKTNKRLFIIYLLIIVHSELLEKVHSALLEIVHSALLGFLQTFNAAMKLIYKDKFTSI